MRAGSGGRVAGGPAGWARLRGVVSRASTRVSLRAQLFVGMALPLVCLAVAGLVLMLVSERRHQHDELRETVRSAVVAMANDLHRVSLLQDQAAGVEAVDRLRAFDAISRLHVLDPGGEEVFAYARPGLDPAPAPEGAAAGAGWMEVPLAADGAPLGSALVRVSSEGIRGAVAERGWRIGLMVLVMLGASLGFAVGVGRLIAAPIARMTGFAVETARTLDTSGRLQAEGSREIGALAGSINQMLVEIASQRERLEATNARIEATVRQRTRELRASERRLRALATHAPVGIVETDAAGVCIFVNKAWTEITGFAPERSLGRAWTHIVHPDERERVAGEWAGAAAAGDAYETECRIRRPDGRDAWVYGGAVVLGDDRAGASGHLCTITDISDQKRMEEELRFGAFHDRLTSLPNRVHARERIGAAIERRAGETGFGCAVFYLDFDRFKWVNDTLGHEAGDAFLVEAARRIREFARGLSGGEGIEATPARLGGDEFVVLVEGMGEESAAAEAARSLSGALSGAYDVLGTEVSSSASIGVACLQDEHATADDLLRDADAAMYSRKASGRRGVAVFDASMRDATLARARLEEELEQALGRGEFELHYQPIVSLEDRRPAGFEALLRWRHPARGLIAPCEFLGVAEESGLIIPIGRWVLGQACHDLRLWQSWMPDPEPFFVSVNLSRRHLEVPSLVDDVVGVQEGAGVSAGCLVLEVTESTIMHDMDASIAVLSRLRDHGVRIAMDDFGTGYSSLAYLRRLPLDILKIDRSFLGGLAADKRTMAILDAIVSLASNMEMPVVAEGIEDGEALATLQALDCAMGQGFLFARPMQGGDIPAWCVRASAMRGLAA